MTDFDKISKKLKKRWNFVPFSYTPPHGLIDLFQLFSTPFLTVQIHRINFPDPTGFYHDHPWNFVSFVLRGGYDEYIWEDPYDFKNTSTKKRPLFSIHRIGVGQSHRIYRCKPKTLTLFFCGPWKRDGFTFYQNGDIFDVSAMVESSGGYNITKMR